MNDMDTLIANLHSVICDHNGGVESLTKREYFAAMAMQGLAQDYREYATTDGIASVAVTMADALLKALEEE